MLGRVGFWIESQWMYRSYMVGVFFLFCRYVGVRVGFAGLESEWMIGWVTYGIHGLLF